MAAQRPSSAGDEFHAKSPFAGLDPLAGSGETFPPRGNPPQCVPPVSTWKLVAQQNGNCYYFAPFPKRINGYIADKSQVGALQKFYVKCGDDPFDPAKVICQNPGDDRQGAPPTKGIPPGVGNSMPGGPTASTGNYTRQPVPPAWDPCHPSYDMSTAAGRAAAMQNAASDREACDQERCRHNPQLQICSGLPPANPGGDKGLKRDPIPDQPAPPPKTPNSWVLARTMSECLQARLPGFPIMLIQNHYMDMARYSVNLSREAAAELPPQQQIFLDEIAMALQAQAYRDEKYGKRPYNPNDPDDFNPANSRDHLTGWLDRCVQTTGLETPHNTTLEFAQFLGIPPNSHRVQKFVGGYNLGDVLAPNSMLPWPGYR